LEDEGRGDLVDDTAVLLACVAGLVENLVGFARGKALIPQVDGQAGKRAKLGGEGLRFGGLGAGLAGEVDGVADDDANNAESLGKPGQRAKIFSGDAGRGASSLEGQDGLGGEAELVGDSDADAAVADVEAEIAKCSFQLLAPSSQLKARSVGIGRSVCRAGAWGGSHMREVSIGEPESSSPHGGESAKKKVSPRPSGA